MKCNKCWNESFESPIGSIMILEPKIGSNALILKYNLCLRHIKMLEDWLSGGKNKFPKELPYSQVKLE
jgi:hypothetical protein